MRLRESQMIEKGGQRPIAGILLHVSDRFEFQCAGLDEQLAQTRCPLAGLAVGRINQRFSQEGTDLLVAPAKAGVQRLDFPGFRLAPE